MPRPINICWEGGQKKKEAGNIVTGGLRDEQAANLYFHRGSYGQKRTHFFHHIEKLKSLKC